MQDAVREMEETLGGADLADVAKAAREAGDRALDKHLFRPADGWGRFTRACDLLPTRSAAWDSRSPNRGRRRSGCRGGGDPHAVVVPVRRRRRKRT